MAASFRIDSTAYQTLHKGAVFFLMIICLLLVFSAKGTGETTHFHDSYNKTHDKRSILEQFHSLGELNFSNKEYIEALKNYQKAIDFLHKNNLSDPSKLLNAICSSLFCYELLNENQLAKETFNELVCQVALLNDELENVDWFRNSPVYDNFIMNSIRSVPKIMLTDLPSMDSEEFCQFQCNGYAVAVACACTKVPNLAIQAVCLGCVFGLEQLCIRCCKGEGFWENCVKGLRRLFHDPEHPENPAPHPYE